MRIARGIPVLAIIAAACGGFGGDDSARPAASSDAGPDVDVDAATPREDGGDAAPGDGGPDAPDDFGDASPNDDVLVQAVSSKTSPAAQKHKLAFKRPLQPGDTPMLVIAGRFSGGGQRAPISVSTATNEWSRSVESNTTVDVSVWVGPPDPSITDVVIDWGTSGPDDQIAQLLEWNVTRPFLSTIAGSQSGVTVKTPELSGGNGRSVIMGFVAVDASALPTMGPTDEFAEISAPIDVGGITLLSAYRVVDDMLQHPTSWTFAATHDYDVTGLIYALP